MYHHISLTLWITLQFINSSAISCCRFSIMDCRAEAEPTWTIRCAASLWLIFVQHVPFFLLLASSFQARFKNATWSEMKREWWIKNDVASCSTVQKHAIKLLTIKIKKNFLYYLNTTSPDRRHHHRLLLSAVRRSSAPCCLWGPREGVFQWRRRAQNEVTQIMAYTPLGIHKIYNEEWS